MERAAFDFSQTEEFLQAAEGIVGPYEWGRYDVLCLPPSFPYGGMENPCLTFVTPTLLVSPTRNRKIRSYVHIYIYIYLFFEGARYPWHSLVVFVV